MRRQASEGEEKNWRERRPEFNSVLGEGETTMAAARKIQSF
jgi:hypothetical protein